MAKQRRYAVSPFFSRQKLPVVSSVCDVVRPLLEKCRIFAVMRLIRKHRYALTRCGDCEGIRIRPEEFFEATVAILNRTRGDRVRKGRMYEPMSSSHVPSPFLSHHGLGDRYR